MNTPKGKPESRGWIEIDCNGLLPVAVLRRQLSFQGGCTTSFYQTVMDKCLVCLYFRVSLVWINLTLTACLWPNGFTHQKGRKTTSAIAKFTEGHRQVSIKKPWQNEEILAVSDFEQTLKITMSLLRDGIKLHYWRVDLAILQRSTPPTSDPTSKFRLKQSIDLVCISHRTFYSSFLSIVILCFERGTIQPLKAIICFGRKAGDIRRYRAINIPETALKNREVAGEVKRKPIGKISTL